MTSVSVIIPTYNRSQMLKRAVTSVLEQTYKDFEIIVISDCSTDDTDTAMTEFNDERIKYIKLTSNSGGAIVPRQNGLKVSVGKYIAALDDDDFWVDRRKLELQVEYLERHPECVMVGTDALIINSDGTIKTHHYYPRTFSEIRGKMLLGNWFYHSSVVYRRSTFVDVGEYPIIPSGYYAGFGDEYELWLKMGEVGELVNLPIDGVGHTYPPRTLRMRDHIYLLVRRLRVMYDHRTHYPYYLVANIFTVATTMCELPILSPLKRYLRRFRL